MAPDAPGSVRRPTTRELERRSGPGGPDPGATLAGSRPLTEKETAWALDLIGRYRTWKHERGEACP